MQKTFVAALLLSAVLFVPPARAQSSLGSDAQDLSNCAGAVAATGNLDVLIYPREASGEWADVLGRILEQLNRVEGVEGMTGRYAASAARSFWAGQPRAQREAAANTCRQRYGG